MTSGVRWIAMGVVLGVSYMGAIAQTPQYPNYPSETPATFKAPTSGMDYERREAMIAMRDGVKLHTVVLVPKGAKHEGILLTRTPYSANALTSELRTACISARLCGDTTMRPRPSSREATSAWCRTSAASMGVKATT